MAEKLEVYDLDSNLIGLQERLEFYNEIKSEFAKKGKISKKVKTIKLMLLTSMGKMYLQKRSKIKGDNAGMYDKSVGGHVEGGDSYNMTAIKECAEELGFPISIVKQEEFNRATKTSDLNIISIVKKVAYDPDFLSIRIKKNGEQFVQPQMVTFYIGYYDGALKFSDGESSGIEVFTLDELRKEIASKSDKFTNDIKVMIKTLEVHLKPLKKT